MLYRTVPYRLSVPYRTVPYRLSVPYNRTVPWSGQGQLQTDCIACGLYDCIAVLPYCIAGGQGQTESVDRNRPTVTVVTDRNQTVTLSKP